MRVHSGIVNEIRLEQGGRAAWIACPPAAIPAPGQYLHAWAEGEDASPRGTALFAAEIAAQGFLAAPPVPETWEPGTRLELRGPLGRGFSLPPACRRLALAILGETPSRLLPLLTQALAQGAEAALFSDLPLPRLPAQVEARPLDALGEALSWADFLACDLPLEALPALPARLGLAQGQSLPCPAQALLFTPMPCAGLAQCGVCAAPLRRGWKLVCEDGPVFNLSPDWLEF